MVSLLTGNIPKYIPVRKENVSECVKYFLNEYQHNGIEYENDVRSWVVLHGWGVDKTDIERGLIMACRDSEEVVLFDGEETKVEDFLKYNLLALDLLNFVSNLSLLEIDLTITFVIKMNFGR